MSKKRSVFWHSLRTCKVSANPAGLVLPLWYNGFLHIRHSPCCHLWTQPIRTSFHVLLHGCLVLPLTCTRPQSTLLSIRLGRRGSDQATEAASPTSAATAPEYQRAAPTVTRHGGHKRDASDGAGASAKNTPGARMLNVIRGKITGRRCGRKTLRVTCRAEERRREAVTVYGFTGSRATLEAL